MGTHIACGSGNKDIAYVTLFSAEECIHGIALEKFIYLCIIVIVKIEQLIRIIYLSVLEKLCKGTRSGMLEHIAVGYLKALF